MIEILKESLLYWDLTKLPSIDLNDLVQSVQTLNEKMFFKQIIITADESVLPGQINQVAKPELGADIYIPKSITIRVIGENTIHKDHFITPQIVVDHIWEGEQLISIGHAISGAFSVGDGNEFDITYQEFATNISEFIKFG